MQSRTIIGIHGLANKPPREEKLGWWKEAILEGLARNCAVSRSDIPFDFCYWADLRYETPLEEDRNREPYRPAPGTGPFPVYDPDAGDAVKNTLADRFYRAVAWLEETTGFAPFDDVLIEYRLDDLYGYLEDAEFRAAARGRMREVIERNAGTCSLLAAHSMGALIAYDVLRMMAREGAPVCVEHLVTMGAPMGLAEVKLKMAEEHGDLVVPDGIARWSNLADPDDIATVGESLHDAYAPSGRGVRAEDIAVVNAYRRPRGDRNRHKSYGYLRTPEFSRAVRDFLAIPDERETGRELETRAAE